MSNLRNILRGLAGAASNLIDRDLKISRRKPPVVFEPLFTDGLTAACRDDWPAEGDELSLQWNKLYEKSPWATAFHTSAWQRAAYDATSAGAPLRLVTVHDGPTLIAALPLIRSDDGTVVTPGAAVSDYLDPLIADKYEARACRAILNLMRRLWDRRAAELVFHNVRHDAPSRAVLLAESSGAGFDVEEKLVENAPAVALPRYWEAFLESLDGHERKELRRKINKAREQGNAQLIACRTDSQIAEMLPKAIELMASRGGDKSDAVGRFLAPLLRSVAPELIRRGRLDLLTLIVNEKPAACLLQFPGLTGPMLYNCGVDYSLKEWSPGVVAVALAIERAIGEGAGVYDMLRGQEAYKYKFGAVDRGVYRIAMRAAK